MRAPLRTLVVGIVLLGQAWVFVASRADAVTIEWRGRNSIRHGPPSENISSLTVTAWRDLRAVAADIPADSRVLLLTDQPFPLPYDYYLLPRPLRVLMRWDEDMLARASASFPPGVVLFEWWRAQVEQRELARDPQRLAAALAEADVLLTFQAAAPDIPRLTLLAEHGAARAWALPEPRP